LVGGRKTRARRSAAPYRHRHYGPRQAEELQEIDAMLVGLPELVDAVARDIESVAAGEQEMTAEQCLRAFIIKEMNDYDYATLALKLADSRGYESFCKTDALDAGPRRRETLEAFLEKISVETVARLHAALLRRCE
jgi:hypothetical protein